MFELSELPQPKPSPVSSDRGCRRDGESSSSQETARDTSQIFVRRVFSVALQSAVAVQLTWPLHWVVALGPLWERAASSLGQISEFEAFLPRDLAAGWSWLREACAPKAACVSAAEDGFHAVYA